MTTAGRTLLAAPIDHPIGWKTNRWPLLEPARSFFIPQIGTARKIFVSNFKRVVSSRGCPVTLALDRQVERSSLMRSDEASIEKRGRIFDEAERAKAIRINR